MSEVRQGERRAGEITITQSVKFRTGKKTFKRPVVFVALPKQLLLRPPVRHRGEPPASGLTIFEFCIAGACVALASRQLVQARHDAAMRDGQLDISLARSQVERVVHGRMDGKPARELIGPGKNFKAIGRRAYHRARHRFDGDDISLTIQISKSGLLRVAGLARKGAHVGKIVGALHRLQKPVGKLPPLLDAVKASPYGSLRITVNGQWLPSRQYARVAWPPPTRGSTVLALYLFLSALDYRDTSNRNSIQMEVLCRRLGIPLSYNAHVRRSLDRALKAVNDHLQRLNEDGALAKHNLTVGFEIAPVDDGMRVRFSALDAVEARRKRSQEREQRKERERKQQEERQRHRLHDDDDTTDDKIKRRQPAFEILQAEADRRAASRQQHLAMKEKRASTK